MHGLVYWNARNQLSGLLPTKTTGSSHIFSLWYWQNLVKMKHFLGNQSCLPGERSGAWMAAAPRENFEKGNSDRKDLLKV